MKCYEPGCTGKKLPPEAGAYPYTECRAAGFTLQSVDTVTCDTCGTTGALIGNVHALHGAIAYHIASVQRPLDVDEFTFLRNHVQPVSGEFARLIGVAVETVSRWENGTRRWSATVEGLLRVLVWGGGNEMLTAQMADAQSLISGKVQRSGVSVVWHPNFRTWGVKS